MIDCRQMCRYCSPIPDYAVQALLHPNSGQSTYSECHTASQLVHLPEEGLDERRLACSHVSHHSHQLARPHVDVQAYEEGRGEGRGGGGGQMMSSLEIQWNVYTEFKL